MVQQKEGKKLMLQTSQIFYREGFNVREDMGDMKSLKQSISDNGIHTPITVIKGGPKEKVEGGLQVYYVINGHRRTQAAEEINNKAKDIADHVYVPAIEVSQDSTEADLITEMLVTGGQQLPLTMLERAFGIQKLMVADPELKKAAIARSLGVSQTHIDDCLTLLKATDATLDIVRSGAVPASTVVEMIKTGAEPERVEKDIAKTVAKAEGQGKSKVTAADVEKATGKPASKKSAAKASTKKGATEESGKAKKVNPILERLTDLQEVLEAQTDGERKEDAFAFLAAIVNFAQGRYEPIDMTGLFFEGGDPLPELEDEVEETPEEKPAPKAKKQTKAEILAAETAKGPENKGAKLREMLAGTEEEKPKKAASKKAAPKAPAAPKKSATPPPEDDDLDEDLDGTDLLLDDEDDLDDL